MKITYIAEIVQDKFPESTFLESALKLPKTTETVVQICAQTLANQIIKGGGARGCKRMQESNAQNLEAPKIKMHLSVNP